MVMVPVDEKKEYIMSDELRSIQIRIWKQNESGKSHESEFTLT